MDVDHVHGRVGVQELEALELFLEGVFLPALPLVEVPLALAHVRAAAVDQPQGIVGLDPAGDVVEEPGDVLQRRHAPALEDPIAVADVGRQRHLVGDLPHQHRLAMLVSVHRFVDVLVQQPPAAGLRVRDQLALLFLAEDPALAGFEPGVGERGGAEGPDQPDIMPVA